MAGLAIFNHLTIFPTLCAIAGWWSKRDRVKRSRRAIVTAVLSLCQQMSFAILNIQSNFLPSLSTIGKPPAGSGRTTG
jgi:hypothetical protein